MQKNGLGQRLQEFRESLDLSQDQLGDKLNCTQSKVYKIENGLSDINSVDASTLHELGVDLNWFIAGDGQMLYKQKELKRLEHIKEEFNLSDEHLSLIHQFLVKPDLREQLISIIKNIQL